MRSNKVELSFCTMNAEPFIATTIMNAESVAKGGYQKVSYRASVFLLRLR